MREAYKIIFIIARYVILLMWRSASMSGVIACFILVAHGVAYHQCEIVGEYLFNIEVASACGNAFVARSDQRSTLAAPEALTVSSQYVANVKVSRNLARK